MLVLIFRSVYHFEFAAAILEKGLRENLDQFTVEPRYNEEPSDRENVFVITGFCSIHFTVIGWAEEYRSL